MTEMELKGTKIIFLGDSITDGWGASSRENVYWKVLARLSGAECYGNGVGGSRIAPQRTPSEDPNWDRYYGSRVEELPKDADMVVVFGGTNDFGHGDAALGALSDRTEDTFYGALRLLCERLLERYPQVVLITPLHRLGENNDYNELGARRCATLEGYVDAICQVGALYGIPVLDLFRTSGIQPAVDSIRERYLPDGLHPNDAGYLRIAQRLMGFLQTL